jgi:hypothetical protein
MHITKPTPRTDLGEGVRVIMIHRSRPIRRLFAAASLASIVAVALMALTASNASATVNEHWYVGGQYVHSPTLVEPVSKGVFSFEMSAGGYSVRSECKALTGLGKIENSETTGTSNTNTFTLTGCKVVAPQGMNCTVRGAVNTTKSGEISFNVLKGKTLGSKLSYTPESGTSVIKVVVENCTQAFLNGNRSFSGQLVSVPVVGEPGVFEFSHSSGSEFWAGVWFGTLTGRYALSTPKGEVVTLGP